MSWITTIWTMAAAACLTLASIQCLVWLYSREARASLLFAVAATAAAAMAFLEIKLMHTQSAAEYGEILRWMHVAVATVVVAIVWFIPSFLHSGRHWLAWSITGLRLLVLIFNFLIYPNASFAEIHSLQFVDFWGETFSVPVGEENPWRWIILLSTLLFLIYVLDAAVSAWKQGQRRRALVFGSAVIIATLLSVTNSALMVRGILPGPFITLIFLVIVAAMALELSMDLLHARQLATELQQHRRDLAHVARVTTLGQLSSSLAHEINQPLGAILRNTEAAELYLQQTPPDLDEIKAILVDIRKDNQRAVAVIERMRALLKRRELQFEPISIAELIEQIINLLHAEIQAHHVSISVELPDFPSKVRGDRVHLQQVLINLILNSLDALNGSEADQREIVIRATRLADNMLEISVVDFGAGIPEEQVPHLFEAFYTTKTKGTGIGLAISKTIINVHGGKIAAENNPDIGATVRFTLPIA